MKSCGRQHSDAVIAGLQGSPGVRKRKRISAAAPNMLAALQRVDDFLSRLTPTGNIASLHSIVREAIAKATTP